MKNLCEKCAKKDRSGKFIYLCVLRIRSKVGENPKEISNILAEVGENDINFFRIRQYKIAVRYALYTYGFFFNRLLIYLL